MGRSGAQLDDFEGGRVLDGRETRTWESLRCRRWLEPNERGDHPESVGPVGETGRTPTLMGQVGDRRMETQKTDSGRHSDTSVSEEVSRRENVAEKASK